MKYLLDTDICVYFMKGSSQRVLEHMQLLGFEEACVSSIVLAELYIGVEKSVHKEKNQAILDEFLRPHVSLDFDEKAAAFYAKVRADLERRGQPIGPMDMLIAAHALSQNLILITNNEREFSRVPGLKIENWTKA